MTASDPEAWHAAERARYALTLAEVLQESPLLADAAKVAGPTKLLRCPRGHRLLSLTPAHDAHGRIVLQVRDWVDPRILQPSYPGARPRELLDGTPNELEPKVTLACKARGCRYRRAFARSDLLRHFAANLYRRGDITLPP